MSQNKGMPGAYINFVSAARASSNLTERGIAAVPLVLDWGPENEVIAVTAETFEKNSRKIFGYDATADAVRPVREIFRNARLLYTYKLNAAVKASNDFATAKYGGKRGNAIKIVIQKNADDQTKFDVQTVLDTTVVNSQTAAKASDLIPNDFVDWKKEAALAVTAGTALTGGANGEVTGESYQTFLNKIETYSFHALGCPSKESTVTALFAAFTKRMRDTVGAKFQTVLYRTAANYEGVISVENKAAEDESALVYWMTGAAAGCAVNKSNSNKTYDGEYTVDTAYTQSDLEKGIQAGKLMFHKVGDEIRVLTDINTLTDFTQEKSSDFGSNQTIRVLDQIANDIAALFNTRYLGNVPNDAAGRISLWNDIVSHHRELETVHAIEGFEPKNVKVTAGETKKSITVADAVTPVNAMEQLYMTVLVQ